MISRRYAVRSPSGELVEPTIAATVRASQEAFTNGKGRWTDAAKRGAEVVGVVLMTGSDHKAALRVVKDLRDAAECTSGEVREWIRVAADQLAEVLGEGR